MKTCNAKSGVKNLIALVGLFLLATSATFSVKTETMENTAIKGVSNESFIEFLSHFEKKDLPFNIGIEDLEAYNGFIKNKGTTVKVGKRSDVRSSISNSTFIPEAKFGKMSRMGPPELIPVARFYPNEKMIAVIYSSQLRFGSGADRSYTMLIYDMKGNILPKGATDINEQTLLAAHSSVEQSITCRIDEKGRIWRNTYKNIWKEDLDKKWINENEITGFEIENTEVFELDKNGKLEQLKEIPTVAKACLN